MCEHIVDLKDRGIEIDHEKKELKYARWEDGRSKVYACKRRDEEVSVNSWPQTWAVTFTVPAGALIQEGDCCKLEWHCYDHEMNANLECDGDSLEYIEFLDEAPYISWMLYVARE